MYARNMISREARNQRFIHPEGTLTAKERAAMKTPNMIKDVSFGFSLRIPLKALIGIIVLAALTSCRTTAGLGRDVQHVGAKIESKAIEHS